jgi:alpha-beta hydrolase superfamily lysophospholipase
LFDIYFLLFLYFSLDLRGYGQKWTPRIDGYIPEFEIVCNDLFELVETAKQAHPGLPVFLAGHSMVNKSKKQK